jgi:hypothetical protein
MTNREAGKLGGKAAQTQRRAEKAAGMAFARAWKAKSRKTNWSALVLVEAGLAEIMPVPCVSHMPFAGHRSQAEVGADEARIPAAA